MTGGNTRYDEILQFSIVDLYKGVVFNEYIKPRKCKSWKDTEAIHHITPEIVKDCFTINAHQATIKIYLNMQIWSLAMALKMICAL